MAGESLTPIFRGVVTKMSAEQRTFMESVIREWGGVRRSVARSRENVGEMESIIGYTK